MMLIVKTVILCHRGLYHFSRMPMGLSDISMLFQGTMDVILKGLICFSFMLHTDDVDCEDRVCVPLWAVPLQSHAHGPIQY